MLLAAMDVDDIDVGKPRRQPTDVPEIVRAGSAREAEGLDAWDSLAPRPVDDLGLGPTATAERDLVAAAVELPRRSRGPVGVRRPATAGQEMQDPQQRLR